MLVLGIFILAIAVLALAISVAIMFTQIRHTHRASVSLQLTQQAHTPYMTSAIALVQQISGKALETRPAPLTLGEQEALREVIRFFAHCGELVRRGIGDDEVFALMGGTISEMWHATSALRRTAAASLDVSALDQDNFDWLYVEWLNWDYSHRALITTGAPAYALATARAH